MLPARKPLFRRRPHNPHLLRDTLERAGFTAHWMVVTKRIFMAAVIITALVTLGLLVRLAVAATAAIPVAYVVTLVLVLFTLGLAAVLAACWLMVYLFLDLRIVQRRLEVEEVLPVFLQLTAANIRAGMSPDAALWQAVRPRFGVLAKEVEMVAKDTLAGESLSAALRKFSGRYDSVLLKRSVNLLIEGMEAGAELADVLNKVAMNIQESRLLQKEMTANIATYTIFIGSAAILAAPVLLALAAQLLSVLNRLVSSIGGSLESSASQVSGLSFFALGTAAVDPAHFRVFAIVMLLVTSLFSSMMISAMKRGTILEGMKNVPLFMGISLLLYLVASKILGVLLGGFFAKAT